MKPLENLDKYEILLASNSPRRRELLAGLGLKFTPCVINGIDESCPEDVPAKETALAVAQIKAQAYKQMVTGNRMVITADTVVVCDDEVLGKPASKEEAVLMLRKLSGKRHFVVTGVTVSTVERSVAFSTESEVEFDLLSDDEIGYYVEKFNPVDKAGAYGIQEWIGYMGVKSISGSFYNVMGLPVQRLYTELKKF